MSDENAANRLDRDDASSETSSRLRGENAATRGKEDRRRRWGCAIVSLVFLGLFVGVAVAIGLTALQITRDAACESNLTQLGIATNNFQEVYLILPTGGEATQIGMRPVSWRVELLPFLEQNELFDQYDVESPWDSEANQRVAKQMPELYVCPGEGRGAEASLTSYFAIDGDGALFEKGEAKRIKYLQDSVDATLMYVESHGQDVVWTEPRDLSPDDVNSSRALSRSHWNGANVVYADGSVRSLSADVDPIVLKALTTDSGGENIHRP